MVFLNLSSNLISEIDSSAFIGCSNLSVLDLSYNRLAQLSPRTFQGLSMNLLSIRNNQITKLDNLTFSNVANLNS